MLLAHVAKWLFYVCVELGSISFMRFVLSTISSPYLKLMVLTSYTISPEVSVACLDPVVDEATGQ